MMTDLTKIEKLSGWCSFEKAQWLYQTIRKETQFLDRPLACLEVGVFGGKSLLAMAYALKDEGRGFIVGIDPYTQTSALEGMVEDDNNTRLNVQWWGSQNLNQFHQEAERAINHLRNYAAILVSPSEKCVQLFSNLDLCHVDGNHHMSLRDVNIWYPRVRKDGILIMDDANWHEVADALQWVRERAKQIAAGPAEEWIAFRV